MGQYLAIGIITKYATAKKELEKRSVTKEILISEMKNALHFDDSIYDLVETSENYTFNLKPEILETELIAFLEKIYPFLYPDKTDYESDFAKLKSKNPSDYLEFAKGKSCEMFQFDNYGEDDYLDLKKQFNVKIQIYSDTIMLSNEGKIMMESFGRQFEFFKYCMQQTFAQFALAKALRVYITG